MLAVIHVVCIASMTSCSQRAFAACLVKVLSVGDLHRQALLSGLVGVLMIPVLAAHDCFSALPWHLPRACAYMRRLSV